MSTESEARDRLVGILLIILSSAAFGVLDGLSKILVQTLPPVEIVWGRYALAIPFLLFSMSPLKWPSLVRSNVPFQQILRGLMPIAVSFGMVLGVQHLPLADTTVILFLAPLLVVALSAPMLGEHVHRSNWLAVGVGFVAVLLVARPGFSVLSQFAIYPLVAAVFFALLQIVTRRLAAAGEPPRRTLLWTLVSGSLVVTPFAILNWQPPDLTNWLLLIALGGTFGVAQLTQIAGLARAPASLVAPLAYVQIIAAVVFGLVVFHEVPDLWSLIGIVMIFGAGLYVVQNRRRA